MNQCTSLKVSKRVPGQYHLVLHDHPFYKGLPVLNYEHGLVVQYLDCLHQAIHSALQNSSRIFAVRVDLRFPDSAFPAGYEVLSNWYFQAFIKAFKRRLQKQSDEKRRLQQRVHKMVFEYVWARECGRKSGNPHYHLLLLLNGHSFNKLGSFSDSYENLYNRIRESWAEALGRGVCKERAGVHFPDNGQYMLEPNEPDALANLFRRASYLAKVNTKDFHGGYHVFGSSR